MENDQLTNKRDAYNVMEGNTNAEGELHTPLTVPPGAFLTSVPVGGKHDRITVYWSERSNNTLAESAYVMIHGRTRNGNDYWRTMENSLVTAVNDGIDGASNHSIVIAPQFFSAKYNSGQYNASDLAWGDTNAWQPGEIAVHPPGTQSSSFDVLDAFVREFTNQSKYPNLKNITLVGHGGGGQLMQRYAILGRNPPSRVHVRYIYGDPSSSLYFTTDRPEIDLGIATKTDCPLYNTFRYGFDNITDAVLNPLTPFHYFTQYIQRDVVAMIGYQDTDPTGGDQTCAALLLGGHKRRDRNLAYWKYINLLAQTNFDLTGFNATFDNLPDWSNVTGHSIAQRLIVIPNASHDANKVFGSPEGRAALFSSRKLPTGWRPQGWNPKGTGQYQVTDPVSGAASAAAGQAIVAAESSASSTGTTTGARVTGSKPVSVAASGSGSGSGSTITGSTTNDEQALSSSSSSSSRASSSWDNSNTKAYHGTANQAQTSGSAQVEASVATLALALVLSLVL